MGQRVDLNAIFKTFTNNVYFQPPEDISLQYPCIIYSRTYGDTQFANDKPYSLRTRYQVMVLDQNPDSEIPGKVALLPTCVFDRHYVKDNVNHDVYKLYY